MAAMSPQKRKRDSQDMPDMRAAPGIDHGVMDFNDYTLNTEDDGQDIDFGSAPLAPQSHSEGHLMNDTSLQQPQQQQQQQQQQPPQQPEQQTTNHQRSHSQNQGIIPSASDTATAALAQFHNMNVPQPTENTFMHQPTEGGDRVSATPVDQTPQQRSASFGDMEVAGPNGDASSPTGAQATPGGSKPTVGSDEWHKVRRDNHKEVERRRRETINEGINEIAKIVPGCEKNKGSILARAVQFITQLKDNETQNIEKWTLEKLLTEQAISELSASCDKLKNECQRAWAECEQWKKAAQKAGVTSVDSVEGDAKATTGEDGE